tara:strand:- start:1466 stop:1939 length:474 start_codon:yes stop_codon:yes gene_type:complete
MQLTSAKENKVLQPKTKLWTIELTDLGAHQAFMGYSLTSKYLMIGITSPMLESQISINSIPTNEEEEIKVPIYLEKCNDSLVGHICFKGLEKISEKWDVFFNDHRFDESVKVKSSVPIPIKRLAKNTRSEHLRLIGYTKSRQDFDCFFEIHLRPKMN